MASVDHRPYREWKIDEVLHFGKYKGRTIGEVFRENWHYLDWALKEIPSFGLHALTVEEFRKISPTKTDSLIRTMTAKLAKVAPTETTGTVLVDEVSSTAHWQELIKKKEEEKMRAEQELKRIAQNPLAGTW
jgi:hypothetical protein